MRKEFSWRFCWRKCPHLCPYLQIHWKCWSNENGYCQIEKAQARTLALS